MRTKEEVRDYNATYKAAHKEEAAAYMAAYRADRKQATRAYDAAYNATHKEERSAYKASYYLDHRDAILEKVHRDQAEFTEWLQILRTNNGCEDCETHEGLLDHHHTDPDTKRYQISNMYSCSLDALEDELEKCVVLCRSCHLKRHAIERT